MLLHVVSGLARFGLVLGVGALSQPEALGIERYNLELQLDRFSALEVARTTLHVHLKSGDETPCSVALGGWVTFSLLAENFN